MYKLSPSDFKYLWEDCKHCFYHKVKFGVTLPSIGIPGVFNKMSGQIQAMAMGKNPSEFHADLPSGKFEIKEGFLKSTPIPPTGECYISGRFDLLTKFDDGSYGVIDLKITDPSSDNLYKFGPQLHAYKFALENPAPGNPKVGPITKLGLLIMSPESIEHTPQGVHFHAQPTWHEIPINMDSFYNFIGEVHKVLLGEPPQPSSTCAWCTYRTYFQNKPPQPTQQQHIPF